MKRESLILLILDGVGDLPKPKTPLQAAKKPNMDKLAKEGITGMFSPLGRGIVPGSDTSHLQLFGYEPEIFYPGRGPLEALGIGMEIRPADIAFRTNFGTVRDDKLIDRRAGRIETEEAQPLQNYLSTKIDDIEIIFKSSTDHRGAVIFRGPGLSPHVSDTDPHATGKLVKCIPLNETPEAKKTAAIVNKYMEFAMKVLGNAKENKMREKNRKLPANILLLRGAGEHREVPSFVERFGIEAACVAGGALYCGVSKYIGMDVFRLPKRKNKEIINEKAAAAAKATENYDLVFLHIKGCDDMGHDGDFKGKKEMIERIDKEVIPIIVKSGASIIITGDHSTPVSRKAHSGHELPILIWSREERYDNVKKFDEINCMNGGLGHISGCDIMPIILNILNKAEKYGS